MKLHYGYDEKTNRIILPRRKPFDGEPVLVRLASGWVEARWEDGYSYNMAEGKGHDGFCWIVLDDSAPQADLDDVLEWLPLPGSMWWLWLVVCYLFAGDASKIWTWRRRPRGGY